MTNEKIERFLAVGPAKFSWVKRLSIEALHTPERFVTHQLELQLLQEPWLQTPRLELIFIDAVEIRIGDVSPGDGLLLDIWDISDRQLERIRYGVADREHGDMIRLRCLDFECRLIA